MNLAILILVMGVCGFLVYRGSGSIWRAVLAGLTLPMIGLIAFVSLVGRDNLDALSPVVLLLGAIAALMVLAFIFRK